MIELRKTFTPFNIVIEDQASETALIQQLQAECVFEVTAYKPQSSGDKITRFSAQSVRFGSGSVWLPKEAPWLDEYVNEIADFPGTKYDDQVDSTAQAFDYAGSHLSVWQKWDLSLCRLYLRSRNLKRPNSYY